MADPSPRPFYPPIVAIFPVLAVFSANVGLFPITHLFRPLMFVGLLGCIVWILSSLISRSIDKGALIASAAFVGFWSFGPLFERWEPAAVWGWISVSLCMVLAVLSLRKWEPPTQSLNRFGILLVLVATASVIVRASKPAIEAAAPRAVAAHTPDIFFIIVDGYGRTDQLQRVMHFDNSPFIAELEKRGFLVANKSNSNYCQTALSLGALLNVDRIQNLIPEGTTDRAKLSLLVDRPRLVRDLRARGYETIAVSTGFPGFSFDGFDLVIKDVEDITYFEATLLAMTPIQMPVGVATSQYTQRQHALKRGFAELRALARPTAKPRFVFAHVLAPHPPFVFTASGQPVQPKGVFGYWDGSDYMTHIGTPESYREGYVEQLKWVNGELLSTLDQLSEGSIVIVQGDHGSKLGLDQDVISKTDLQEAFGNLSAYRVPPPVRAQLSEETTPLNAVRAIAAFVTGQKLPTLPNRSYYSPYNRPTEFVDVTEKVRSEE